MAQFKDVFLTTLKVFFALLIISAVLGVGFLFLRGILGGLGSIANSPSSTKTESEIDARMNDADALRTSMQKSVWDGGIARAVKKHCSTDGMNKEEVAQALGEPTEKTDWKRDGSSWTWQLPSGKCLKYDGDKCVEQEKRKKIIFFTAKGNVYLQGAACTTVNDEYIYFELSQLFVKAAKQASPTKADLEHREAMKLFDAFTDRQANLFAECLTKANGKLNQSQKDHIIYQVWMSTGAVHTCQELANVKTEEVTLQ